jgi:hypothetical protein
MANDSKKPMISEVSFESKWARWTLFSIGVIALLLSVAIRFQPEWFPKGWKVAFDLLGRVGIVCVATWLAWPLLMSLNKLPGGILLVFGIMLTMILFTVRKQSIYLLGPVMAVIVILTMGASWIRRWKA